MHSPVKLPSPEEYAQKIAQRRAKAAKVPQIIERLNKLSNDFASQQKVVESLLLSMASPHGVPTGDIMDGLDIIDEAQRESLQRLVETIGLASQTTSERNTAILQAVQSINDSIGLLTKAIRAIPRPKDPIAPKEIDLAPDVNRLMSAIYTTGQELKRSVSEMAPVERQPFTALQFSVTERDKAGAIKTVKVTGV